MSAHTCHCRMCTGLCQRSFSLHVVVICMLSKTNVLAQVPCVLLLGLPSVHGCTGSVALELHARGQSRDAALPRDWVSVNLRSRKQWASCDCKGFLQVRFGRLHKPGRNHDSVTGQVNRSGLVRSPG